MISTAVLLAMAVRDDGKRSIIGVDVGTSEAEIHWREFLQSLVLRGLHGIKMVTSDDHSGIKKALAAVFSGVAWQRCQCHMQRNAQAHVSKVAHKEDVAESLRSIFNAPTLAHANQVIQTEVLKYQKSEPKLAAWIEANILEGLAVLDLPASHRKRLRTSNDPPQDFGHRV